MNIHAVKTDRMDITIDLASHYVFVQQKWKYNWLIDPNHPKQSAWTYKEKHDFHNKSDQIIWKLWSNKAYLMMQGSSALAQRYRNVKFYINIDVKWVIGSETEHWNVDVYKIPSGSSRGSSANWGNRTITLDSEDYKKRTDLGTVDGQYPVTHELGHTFKNMTTLFSGRNFGTLDEYSTTVSNPSYHSDKSSIMNHGSSVRDRHYEYLKHELNLLLPTALFEVYL